MAPGVDAASNSLALTRALTRARPFGTSVQLALVAVGAIALIAGGRAVNAAASDGVSTFVLVFASIAIEALPFVLLGCIVSALLKVYVPQRTFERVARLPLLAQVPLVCATGAAFPVCECGSVPVARQLMRQGVHPAAAIAFMLAAPVINPIVLGTTYLAYAGRGMGLQMVAARALVGLATAVVVGFVVAQNKTRDEVLRPSAHDHGDEAPHSTEPRLNRLRDAFDHVAGDFLFMGRFVIVGAALAASFQSVVPRSLLTGIGGPPVIATLVLMGLAFALSLCSEADAFVAVSFLGFPYGAQLAFLTFGPVADLKLALLYGATFQRRLAIGILLVSAMVPLGASLVFGMVVG